MDRAERLVLIISGGLLVVFLSAAVFAATWLEIGLPTCITSMEPFESGEVIEHTEDRFEVHYLASMWEFDPEDVEVPVGATLDLYLTSEDVLHGFQIRGTNVNLMAVPGTVNYARVTFNEPGEYRIVCHEFCGVDHHAMAASINVVER
jgi:cytochrome c oxidase subunit 2